MEVGRVAISLIPPTFLRLAANYVRGPQQSLARELSSSGRSCDVSRRNVQFCGSRSQNPKDWKLFFSSVQDTLVLPVKATGQKGQIYELKLALLLC